MKVSDIRVEFGQTETTDRFCNVRPVVSITAKLEEGDDPQAVTAKLMADARQAVEVEVKAARARREEEWENGAYQ